MTKQKSTPPSHDAAAQAPRLPWEAPQLSKLPALTELTLVTGGAIGGGGGGGSTVF
jgi:hypothetical protein